MGPQPPQESSPAPPGRATARSKARDLLPLRTVSQPRARFLAAAAQMTASDDLSANLRICKALAADAAARGASLFVLPECFAFMGSSEADKLAVAETLDPAKPGPILFTLLDIATRYRQWVVGGGMPEKLEGDEGSRGGTPRRAGNTCVVVSPDGEVAARYRKIHLFDVAIPGKAEHKESASTAPGREVVTVETPLGRLGLSVCYDLRFPELYRALALDHGAEVLIVPAAFTAHTGAAHWHVLLRARAIENQCFVVAAGQVGVHNPKRATYGHSMVIDPWGTPIAELADGAGVVVAEIDPDALARVRREMPCASHRVLR
jgi:predicted amidohydrolase